MWKSNTPIFEPDQKYIIWYMYPTYDTYLITPDIMYSPGLSLINNGFSQPILNLCTLIKIGQICLNQPWVFHKKWIKCELELFWCLKYFKKLHPALRNDADNGLYQTPFSFSMLYYVHTKTKLSPQIPKCNIKKRILLLVVFSIWCFGCIIDQ